MDFRRYVSLFLLSLAFAAGAADDEAAVRAADARYWQAYNACDMSAMGALLTEDVEFYHDRTGLTATRAAVLDSLRKGPCADPAMHLRREAVEGSIGFHPLAGGFALLSGTHRFHVRRDGEPEHLDGQAEFTTVWQSVGGQWRMHRILSYAHGAVPYTPPATRVAVSPATLARYAGTYHGAQVGEIRVAVENDHLQLIAGPLVATLFAESQSRFFAIERDLRFSFEAPSSDRNAHTLIVFENGKVVETATRQER